MEFTIVNNKDQLQSISYDLNQLFSCCRTEHLDVHHHPDVLISELVRSSRFAVACAWENGFLVCILPLKWRDSFNFSISILPKIKLRIGHWELIGSSPVISKEIDISCINELLRLTQKNTSCSGIYLNCLVTNSPLDTAIKQGPIKYIPCFVTGEEHHYLLLPGKLSEFLSCFSRKRRYNFNRNVRLLEESEEGNVELREYRSLSQDIDEFIDLSEKVRKISWQGKTLGTSLSNEQSRNEQKRIAKHGLMRSFILLKSGNPIAFIRGYQIKTHFIYEEIGYDPEWSRFSPGTVLNWISFQKMYESDTPECINFGLGNAQYKHTFGNSVSLSSAGFITPLFSILGFVSTIQSTAIFGENMIRKVLKTFRMDKIVRKMLRR